MNLAKAFRLARVALRNLPLHARGRCTVCGRRSLFVCTSLDEARNNMLCVWCRSSSRKRHVALALLELAARKGERSLAQIGAALPLDVHSAAANEAIHRALGASPRFSCSEYFDGVAPGARGPNGVRCEDLERLTFRDASLDVVITEDVMEHVLDPRRAFREIHRVLRPGGHHLFTVPCPTHTHLARAVVPRVAVGADGVVHVHPPAFHEDPLRGKVLVATDFGTNLLEELHEVGFETSVLLTRYALSRRHGIFDSYVFVSRRVA